MLISPPRADLCLGYVNTLSWRGARSPSESLQDFDVLLDWLAARGGLSASAARRGAAWSRSHRAKAARVFVQAIALREALYRLCCAVTVGKTPSRSDFALLQRMLSAAPSRRLLVRTGDRYAWRTEPRQPSAPCLLAPVLWSAADILVDRTGHRLRRCANDECLWLFLDESRTGTRRWCDMAACGNRAKAHRHYLRSKARG